MNIFLQNFVMDNSQKRGPYKRYLEPGSVVQVPKRTRNYRKAKLKSLELEKQNFHPKNEQEVGQVVLESYEDEIENNPESTSLSDNCDNDNTAANDQLSIRSSPVGSVLPNRTADIHNWEDENDNLDEEEPYNYCDSSDTHSEDLNAIDDDNHDSNSEEVSVNNNDIEGTDENPRNFQDQDNNDVPIRVSDSDQNEIHYPKSVLVRSLLLLAVKLRKNIDNETVTYISKLIDAIADEPLCYNSTYHFNNIINQYTVPIEIHHLCSNCKEHIGSELYSSDDDMLESDDETEHPTLHCNKCNIDIDLKQNKHIGNIFLHLSLTQQLQKFFEHNHENLMYVKNRTKQCSYAIEDIFDGHLYRKNNFDNLPDDMITLNFSIDGTPLFKASQTSITPIVCTVNEINPKIRNHHIILTSLYLGTDKPDINEYMKPFVEETKILFDTGFQYKYNNVVYHKKCQILIGICDSVERPKLRGSKSFRGEYGCGLCKHKGEEIAKSCGHVRIFPIDDDGNAHGEGLRSHTETLIHANNVENGIKHRSILCDIPKFDIIKNLAPDWMHCVALGVCRQFLKLWFDSSYHQREFYHGNHISAIDKLLLSFKPSMDVSRTPRTMSKDRLHLEAHELVIWLLIYSLPILKLFLPNKFVKHWSLLVDGISILSKTSIPEGDVYYAQRNLFRFVKESEQLYGKEHISFNLHLLTHLPESVLNWGPLWTHSAFCYENFHQYLKKLVKSSNQADQQILKSFRSQMAFYKLLDLCDESLTFRQRKLLCELTNRKILPVASLVVEDVGLIGQSTSVQELSTEYFLTLQRINVDVDKNSTIQFYQRIRIDRKIIHAKEYTKVKKRNSYTVLLKNDEIFEVQTFLLVVIQNKLTCFAIGKYFMKEKNTLISSVKLEHMYFFKMYNYLAAVDAKMIKETVTIISIPNKNITIACKHPNRYELLT